VVDADRVVEVLESLLSNAVKYGNRGTPICVDVDASATPGALTIAVTNRGPGIPATDLPNLFHRFSRTAHAHAGPVKGSASVSTSRASSSRRTAVA
jgi:signal transduction histidine kinase